MISIEKVNFRDHKVDLITVENNSKLKVVFTSFGAAIYKVYFADRLVTGEIKDLDKYFTSGMFLGKSVGRTCGRIKDGIAKINNVEYKINKYGKHSLHGGIYGFSFRMFTYQIFETEKGIEIKFFYTSKDMEEGYPGDLDVEVSYLIDNNQDVIEITYSSISNKDTICNLTNHAYFNMNGAKNDFLKQKMMINADQYIDIDDELIFKGIKDVEGPMSFKNLRKFVDDSIDYGEVNLYDHDYILNGVLPNAILTSENEDMSLEIVTNNPILHIYTGPLDGSFNKLGTAIECEKKAYDMNDIYLPKGERRIQKSIYTFKMKGE